MYSNGIRPTEVAHLNQVGVTTNLRFQRPVSAKPCSAASAWTATQSTATVGSVMLRVRKCCRCSTIPRLAIRRIRTTCRLWWVPGEIKALGDYLCSLVGAAAVDPVAQGKTIFEANACNACHGDGGTGGPLAPALTGVATRLPGDKLAAFLAKPSDKAIAGGMPAPKLSDDDMKALVAYLNSLK